MSAENMSMEREEGIELRRAFPIGSRVRVNVATRRPYNGEVVGYGVRLESVVKVRKHGCRKGKAVHRMWLTALEAKESGVHK